MNPQNPPPPLAKNSSAAVWKLPRPYALFIGWCLILSVIFFRPLGDLLRLASTDLHSHTLLVPVIAAYLLYVERRHLLQPGGASWAWAGMLGGVAVAFLIFNRGPNSPSSVLAYGGATTLQILAFVCLVAAGGFVCMGARWMRAAAFPMAFLIFMVPLPEALVTWLETSLKFASADAAGWFFDVTGVPVLRDGVFFQLPGITIEVAQECSGIRSSYVLFMTSLVAAYLFLRTTLRRALFVLIVIPLGIIRNGFRIWVLGWLCVHYGPKMIDTWIHHRGGPVFFVLSLIPLFALLWVLWRNEQRNLRPAPQLSPAPAPTSGPPTSVA